MSTIIKFDLKELKLLANDKKSCVIEKTVTQNFAMEPRCLGNLKESIKKALDCKVGKYIKELNGILISYKNLHILQNVGAIKNDINDLNFQVQGDYFIFQPYVGATLKGIVIKKRITHLEVILHRVFNVVIPRPTEERERTWIGLNVKENQEVVFNVAAIDLYGALPYIRGELDERWISLGQGGDDEDVETCHNKTDDDSHHHQNSVKPMPYGRNCVVPNKVSTRHNTSFDNNAAYNKQISGDNEINVHTNNRSKKHK